MEGTPTHNESTIWDRGAGFCVHEALQSCGVGLISMRERVFALKGQIAILSRPGEGTEIRVQLPIKFAPAPVPATQAEANRHKLCLRATCTHRAMHLGATATKIPIDCGMASL